MQLVFKGGPYLGVYFINHLSINNYIMVGGWLKFKLSHTSIMNIIMHM